jgi:transcriptional regulator with XRE-family HTH domain
MERELSGRQNGAAIRALRIKEQLRGPELATMVGLHPQALRNIENGSRPASPIVIVAIARALAVPVAAITRDARGVDLEDRVPNGAAA